MLTESYIPVLLILATSFELEEPARAGSFKEVGSAKAYTFANAAKILGNISFEPFCEKNTSVTVMKLRSGKTVQMEKYSCSLLKRAQSIS